MSNSNPWWWETTIYQIYPRSYMDSNGDGIGDLQGIISRLDYIQDLGFETVWLSPFFSSPQRDWGYDISNYLDVAPEFGSLADVEQLIKEVHQRGMRILFDLVLNHTSDQHPWFQASRSSRDDPYRDWYIWRDGRGSRPPNNWRSTVGGSAWHFDPATGQWYYASFLPFQPDLNYRNPQVIQAMLEIARHWLDRGVDGFRLDIFHALFKDREFRDNPWSANIFSGDFQSGFFQKYRYNINQPETIRFARQLRQLADSYPEPRLLLGEVYADDEIIQQYLGPQQEGLNLVFLWDFLNLRPEAGYLREELHHYETQYPEPYSPVLVYGNHDHLRLSARIAGDQRIAKLLAVFQFTARGVPVTYYGEEIGMSELSLPKDQWKDPVGIRFRWVPGFIQRAMKRNATRDGCRSPMQWNAQENAGFSPPEAETWLPVNQDYRSSNVSSQMDDPDSLLHVYRRLLQVRRENPSLHRGSLVVFPQDPKNPDLLAYSRHLEEQKVLVLLNFGSREITFQDDSDWSQEILSTGEWSRDQAGHIQLAAYTSLLLIN